MGWAAVGWLPQIYASGGPAVLLPDHRGRAALHRRSDRLRAEAARPVTALVRLPRDLPQLHHRGLRRPLHRDLDPHLRRVGRPPPQATPTSLGSLACGCIVCRWSCTTRATCEVRPGGTRRRQGSWASRASTSVTGRRQTKPRQTYAVGRPSQQRTVGQQRPCPAGPAPPPRRPSRPELRRLAARDEFGSSRILGGARRWRPGPAGGGVRLTALASSQPAKRGRLTDQGPGAALGRLGPVGEVAPAGQLGQQARRRGPPCSVRRGWRCRSGPWAGCRAPRRRRRCRRSRPHRPSNSASTTASSCSARSIQTGSAVAAASRVKPSATAA